MKRQYDFVGRLDKELSINILLCLDNPTDLATVSGVLKSWRRFVIDNGLFKQLCLKLCPDVSKIIVVVKFTYKPERVALNTPGLLERDHRVFSRLSHGLTLPPLDSLIKDAICASSSDRYSEGTVHKTVKPDYVLVYGYRSSEAYCSSEGKSDPTVPETLVYKLVSDFCLVSEIHVQPFQALKGPGQLIYSAEAVRFSLGHPKSPLKLERDCNGYDDNMFIWTYTSPEFPMTQRFKLPRPVLCMGGILKVELLGRVQKSLFDGLYYICVDRVQAVGRNLGPVLDINILDNTGSCILKSHYRAPMRQCATSKRCVGLSWQVLKRKKPYNFMERLDKEMSIEILSRLENHMDLATVSLVCKSWRHFVIENRLFKQLCLKLCPDVSRIIDVEFIDKYKTTAAVTTTLEKKKHRVFYLISSGLMLPTASDRLITEPISVSSSQYSGGIHYTVKPDYAILQEERHWSSKGEPDPTIPETLVYKLVSDFCVISEIYVEPFQDRWEPNHPIYSAEAVCFSMGHHVKPLERAWFSVDTIYDDKMFVWTYISPVFPMTQASDVQRFQLPRPVLCIGGILKVELLGRVQKNNNDGLYYICVDRVQAMGRNLGPVLDIDITDTSSRSCILKCHNGVPMRQWQDVDCSPSLCTIQ